jgi:hypothetical protein
MFLESSAETQTSPIHPRIPLLAINIARLILSGTP